MVFTRVFILFVYGAGILVDSLAAIRILAAYVKSADTTNNLLQYVGSNFALMVGWTVLLIWGVQKPFERNITLLLTAIPVLALLVCNNFALSFMSIIPWHQNTLKITGSIVLLILFREPLKIKTFSNIRNRNP